jgi:hypothetical protein
VWAFLGHVGYYRRFIHKYVGIASPLTNLLKKDQELMCIDVYTWAFHELKMRLTKAPILVPPNWTKKFQVYVDASNFTIGNFLSQKNEKSFDQPIYFASRQGSTTKITTLL